ncbi:MAG: hypothetical protein Q9180_009161, partial [Flavoplaca navasiana]
MVIDAFHDRNGAEEHDLADRESGEHESERGADGIEEEGLGEGVVKGSEGVRDLSLKKMARPNRAAGSKNQYIIFATQISRPVNP